MRRPRHSRAYAAAALALLVSSACWAAACSIQDSEDLTPGDGAGGSGGDRGPATGNGAAGPSGPGGGGPTGTGGAANDIESTPNSVACGDVVCDATIGEVCCLQAEPLACAPDAQRCFELMSTTPPSVMECDDAADCAAGEICCQSSTGGAIVLACTTPATCLGFEACIPGGGCSDGLACLPNEDEPTGAECVGADAMVSCGSATCDGAEVCCDDQSPVCLGPGTACDHAYECDGPSDCGSEAFCCALLDGGSTCSLAACESLTFCASDADCPTGSCSVQAGLDVPDGYQVCN